MPEFNTTTEGFTKATKFEVKAAGMYNAQFVLQSRRGSTALNYQFPEETGTDLPTSFWPPPSAITVRMKFRKAQLFNVY